MIPIRPSKIVCVGRNYVAHAKELGNEVPERPMLFLKPPSALLASGEFIEMPSASGQVEFEGEIGVVIGSRLRRGTEAEAERSIRGYLPANDVTARDLQKPDGQWGRAKGFDTFCPVGDRVVEGLDWRTLSIVTRVNGEERQRAPARDMHFSVPFLLSYISGVMTLEPDDLVLTGTPAGVGRLAAGDVVEVEISGAGVLSNRVRAEGAQ
ncbi:MAG: fumarylacetoacetate hydrolase family protein [Gemmatimonadales bacterium]|nr:fumarylacetoacetate hydrolase family protein [Gemmatimonadales bacterium]